MSLLRGGRSVTSPEWTSEGCEGSLELTVAEARLLASMLDALEPVEPVVFCGLEDGHDGLHYALGQVSGPAYWWLRWDDSGQRRELVEHAVCEVTSEGWIEAEPCALHGGHAGAHSFTRPT